MYRRIVGILLIVLILTTTVVFPVYASTETKTVNGEGVYLGGAYGGALTAGDYTDLNSDDGDDSYWAASASSSYKRTWNFTNSALSSIVVNNVSLYVKARANGPSASTYTFMTHIGASDYYGSLVNVGLETAYTLHSNTWNTNPATGLAWTIGEINAAEFGINHNTTTTATLITYIYLVIDYTTITVPSVTTDPVTSIGSTIATYNGNVTNAPSTITARGFVWDTVTHALPGNVVPGASGYSNNYTVTGTFGTGTYFYNKTGLVVSTTYYVRACAQDAAGWAYGNEVTFSTLTNPSITTVAASNVNATSARLNALVNGDGGQPADVRFGYDIVSRATVAACANQTPWVNDTYVTGSTPYADIAGLTVATPYFFRVEIKNDVGTIQSPNELTFTTSSGVYAPTDFKAIPNGTSISFSWTKGVGASNTKIQYKLNTYPTSNSDGTTAYNGNGASYLLSGLTPGTTYYVRAYGVSGATISTTNVTILATTLAGVIPTTLAAPATPAGWFATPDYTRMSGLPIYGLVNWWSDSFGMPRPTTWFIFLMLVAVFAGIIIYRISNKLPIGMGMTAACITFFCIGGLIPWFLMFFDAIIIAAIWAVGERY